VDIRESNLPVVDIFCVITINEIKTLLFINLQTSFEQNKQTLDPRMDHQIDACVFALQEEHAEGWQICDR
jgi:hypothetical protein